MFGFCENRDKIIPKLSDELESDSIEIPAMIDLPPTGDEEETDSTSYDSDPFADWPDA